LIAAIRVERRRGTRGGEGGEGGAGVGEGVEFSLALSVTVLLFEGVMVFGAVLFEVRTVELVGAIMALVFGHVLFKVLSTLVCGVSTATVFG
jgi:hypothetical protein